MQTILETPRLRLRELTADDLAHLVALHSDPEVMRYITNGAPADPAELREKVLPRWLGYYERFGGWGFYAAELRDTCDFAGWFHLLPTPDSATEFDVGYRLHRRYWGRGLATEGAKALPAKLAWSNQALRVIARTMDGNRASKRVMQKLGLAFEGEYQETRFPGECQCATRYALDFSTIIHRRVWLARQRMNPTVIRKLESGWVVLGDAQTLRGYTLLLSDPVQVTINHLDAAGRAAFLRDMGLVGDALLKVTGAKLINYMILQNTDFALHAHIFARYAGEEPEKRKTGPWAYFPPLPQVTLDTAQQTELIAAIGNVLDEVARAASDAG